jgi:hypothetical protein
MTRPVPALRHELMDHVVCTTEGAAPFVAAMLSAFHGWAARSHTDGTLEVRRAALAPCPECDQDDARGETHWRVADRLPEAI